jgi:hypothetical protein
MRRILEVVLTQKRTLFPYGAQQPARLMVGDGGVQQFFNPGHVFSGT